MKVILKKVFSNIIAGVRIVLCMLSLVICVPLLHVESMVLGYTAERGFKYRRMFTLFYIWILNIRIKKEGFSGGRNTLYVCNHRMMIDPIVVLQYCDGYIVSKAEVANYPILGSGAKHTGVIFVQRDQRDSRAAIKVEIGRLLKAGESVVIFPEGTVNTQDLTAAFSKGSFDEAAKYGCDVVPIALDYKDTGVYWSANISLIRHFLEVFKRWRLVTRICFGSPIKSNDGVELMNKSREFIDQKLHEMHLEWGAGVQKNYSGSSEMSISSK